MKLITAIIKPFKMDDVFEALQAVGVHGITVTEVKGFGRQQGHSEPYRGAEYIVDMVPKLKLEMAVRDEQVELVTKALLQSASSGTLGDGKIFVVDLEEIIRIRTGEKNLEAL